MVLEKWAYCLLYANKSGTADYTPSLMLIRGGVFVFLKYDIFYLVEYKKGR